MGNNELLEAAFGFARSGKANSVGDVRNHLQSLGYTQVQLSQLAGRMLGAQLRSLVRSAATVDRDIQSATQARPARDSRKGA
jgi:hypothetical protein